MLQRSSLMNLVQKASPARICTGKGWSASHRRGRAATGWRWGWCRCGWRRRGWSRYITHGWGRGRCTNTSSASIRWRVGKTWYLRPNRRGRPSWWRWGWRSTHWPAWRRRWRSSSHPSWGWGRWVSTTPRWRRGRWSWTGYWCWSPIRWGWRWWWATWKISRTYEMLSILLNILSSASMVIKIIWAGPAKDKSWHVCISAVWSVFNGCSMGSEGSNASSGGKQKLDQTVKMRRLFWIYTVYTCQLEPYAGYRFIYQYSKTATHK